ncbi:putative C-type lectin domain family 20 member A isoform X1 [Misgurnus anguillicaudatus]|uniref:putative C-type lectin domain family 20 member A isoform X1 n=1 Tax=Misgurnus anguillicaudatus TaxID=75329 RepID=UPI003CCFAD12
MERLIHVLLISAGLCPFIHSIPHGYLLIQEQKTWYEAQAYCRQNHIDLATVESSEDQAELLAIEPALTSVPWIGLYNDINSWRWSNKNESITYENWYRPTGEPNNFDGRETCGFFEAAGTWQDIYCDIEKYVFFCYNEDQIDPNRFVLISNGWRNWYDAQSYCRQYHTDLATIQNSTENNLLKKLMGNYGRAWIGLYRDSWKWSDGTNVNNYPITWMSGEPNIVGLNPSCGVERPGAVISDEICSDPHSFICMHFSRKQIVRVEVKSAQNLNNPAVMEIIIKWMKQKLKDYGIEKDTRLTWKVQSDGNVFTPKLQRENVQQRCLNFSL